MTLFASLRKKAGYDTQQALADQLGVNDRSVIARWEAGTNYPRPHLIPNLAIVLGVSEGDVIAAITESRKQRQKGV